MKYKDEAWLKEQIIGLKKSPSFVAKENGWSPTTVLNWCKKFKIKYVKKYNDYNYMFLEYCSKNKTPLEISRELNVSVTTVEKAIKKMGLSKRSQRKHEASVTLRAKTVKSRYGVENVMQLDSIKSKVKETSLERYGENHFMKTSEGKEKSSKSIFDKYGYKWNVLNPEISNIIKEKYGVENVSHLKSVNDKKRKTLVKNHGTESLSSNGIVNTVNGLTGKQLSEKYDVPYSSVNFFLRSLKFKTEDEIESFLKNRKSENTYIEQFISENIDVPFFNKKVLNYRPDFKLSESLYLNTDGLYWHSEFILDKNYHFKLRKEFEENDLQIIQIREDEILNKKDIVLSIINNRSGDIKNRIFARKTDFRSVSQTEASLFLDQNHLMGKIKAKHFGLYYKDELVSLMSYKEFKDKIKVERFCSKINHIVVGGLSKLFSKLKRGKDIHYWVDLRYGNGFNLEKFGFKKARDTLGWKWADLNQTRTYNRLSCRANMDERGLTQAEHAEELGLVKIYDAGQRLWIRKVK